MTQTMNQFSQSVEKGQLDLHFNPNLIPCMVDTTTGVPLTPGMPVTLVDSASGVPKVIAALADTDDIYGFVPYDARKTSYAAGDYVEIAAFQGNVLYLEASAAIARGARVAVVISGSKVVTASGAQVVVGRAVDKASGSGALIRVYVNLPGESAAEGAFSQAADVAAVATADASDLATAITLVNALKVKVNLLRTNLRAANLMA